VRDNKHLPKPEILLNKYLNIFGDRFYIEVSTYGETWQHFLNQELCDLAKQFSVPIVYANDAHYAYPGQYQLHELVLCMQYQEKASARVGDPHHAPDLYIMDENEVESMLGHLSYSQATEAIDNSDLIASMCDATFPERKVRMPVFVPESKWANSREMFFDLAQDGYQEKIITKGLDSDEYMQRFKD
jgi:DNA polymerase-3 subunit alpha